MRNKISVSYRLSPKGVELIKEMSDMMGISQADVIEMAVRDLSKLKYVGFEMTKEKQEVLTSIAKEKGVTIPEVIREAVNWHLAKMGYLKQEA